MGDEGRAHSARSQVASVVSSLTTTRALLRRHGIRPDKRLGQNFLVSRGALERVVDAAGLTGTETVLEVGAGVGSLTCRLAMAARQVVAVEFDRRLVPALTEVVAGFEGVRIVVGDFLTLPWDTMIHHAPYTVVANIPYNITSALIRRLLEAPIRSERLVLTVQREVAERIASKPGDMSVLALSVQLYGQPREMARIAAQAFYPKPKVDSAVLRIDIHPEPRLPQHLIGPFFRVVRAGFSQRRKQLHNALAGGLAIPSVRARELLEVAGVGSRRRAQELSLEEWGRIAEALLDVERNAAPNQP